MSPLCRRAWGRRAGCAACAALVVCALLHRRGRVANEPLSNDPLVECVRRVAAVPAVPACTRVPGVAVLTMVSAAFFEFRLLQDEAMVDGDCLRPVFVTACLDAMCTRLCVVHGVSNCVNVGGSDGGGGRVAAMYSERYKYINYAKFELIASALTVAEHVLFVDADVLVFREPWAYVLTQPQSLLFQTEHPKTASCDADEANAGVMYWRSDALHTRFFARFRDFVPRMMAARRMNETDQGFLQPVARSTGLSFCGLPSSVFVGQCQCGRDGILDLVQAVTYHATCTKHRAKAKRLQQVVAAVHEGHGGCVRFR
jgi:Nucleotide-diphospho-sugar transferase